MPTPRHALIEVAIEAKSRDHQMKLADALALLAKADSTLFVMIDSESGQAILGGFGEAHLDEKIGVLRAIHGIDANVGAPQVAYRETLGKTAEIDQTHKLVTASGGEFARVKLLFEPGAEGSGELAESRAQHAPLAFVEGALRGVGAAAEAGLVAGFPIIDFKVTLLDVAYHDVDSSSGTFEIAARKAFRELRERGAPRLLEPIMKVEVLTPDEYMGDVIGDLNSRRGQVQGTETRDNLQVVTALAPLSNMFGYINTLRSFSQGRAQFTMQYDHYAPMPQQQEPDPDFSPAIGMRLRA